MPLRSTFLASLFLSVVVLVPGLAHAKKVKFTVDTDPVSEGRVSINGEFQGVAPVEVTMKLPKDGVIAITAEREGALGLWAKKVLARDLRGVIKVRLEKDDAFAATISDQVANKWLTVAPTATLGEDGKVDQDKVWQKLVSVVTDNFSDLEQMDRQSYYLRSAWRVRDFGYIVMRNRLVVKLGVSADFAIKVQLESMYAVKKNSGASVADEDFRPYDRVLKSDKETIDFLRDQL
ncbi:MAG: hypothetical protein KDA24_08505 [Deltaproteobacteria bacterium]|nr:hypothetical protein [Deltaproteobacteria bacterium]